MPLGGTPDTFTRPSLRSLGLSSHKKQNSMRKGWVRWQVATSPGTSPRAQGIRGLPVLELWRLLELPAARPSLLILDSHDICSLGKDCIHRDNYWLNKHSWWCHLCPEILTNNLLTVAVLMILAEDTLWRENVASAVDGVFFNSGERMWSRKGIKNRLIF